MRVRRKKSRRVKGRKKGRKKRRERVLHVEEQMDTMEERRESKRGPVGKENLRLVLSLKPDAVASTTFSLSCAGENGAVRLGHVGRLACTEGATERPVAGGGVTGW